MVARKKVELDLENDDYIDTFSEKVGIHKAVFGSPCMLLDYYLIVQTWQAKFKVQKDEFKHVRVWIRIPRLSIEYYDQCILRAIGNGMGRTIKVDNNTLYSCIGWRIPWKMISVYNGQGMPVSA